MTTATPPFLTLLGHATLRGPDGTERQLERKAAGMLAYLTLEGPAPRSTLAGLLWPEVAEHSARANLRQTLRRLRGAGLALAGEDPVRLSPTLEVDAARLELAAFQGDETQVAAQSGELLGRHDYGDCPDFLEWLTAQRERALTRRSAAYARLSEVAEAAGQLQGALEHAQARLHLDPVSEVAHRRVMTLHARLGDRGAALHAYRHCEEVLRRGLNVSPSDQTRELARALTRSEPLAPAPSRLSRPMPRPAPLEAQPLVGRDREWAALERAWQAGQTLLVAGPSGVGKSRLLSDFLAAHGPLQVFQGRPGDEAVPYLTVARACRALLPLLPPGQPSGWVREELDRLLPELDAARPAAQLPIIQSPSTDPLRMQEALAHILAGALDRGPRLLLLDDLQFCDEASRAAWMALLDHPLLTALGVRAGLTYRPEELSAAALEALTRRREAGAAALLDLHPLDPAGVRALLGELLPQASPELSAALGRHTGGNPLFLLETLRDLGDSGDLAALGQGTLPGPLPLPPRVESLIRRRLERVSAPAQRLAQAAAVAGADLTPALLAAVLEVHPLELAAPWAELETAQIMRGPAFTHDLMADSAGAGVPAPIRALLHGRLAAALEDLPDAEPARAAHHWVQAGEAGRAAPHWVRAGWTFRGRGAWPDATAAFRQALEGTPPHHPTHQDALYGLGHTLSVSEPAQAEAYLTTALAARPGPRRETELRAALSELYRLCGRLQDSREQIVQAIRRAPADATGQERSQLWLARFWTELRSGRLPEAEEAVRQARQHAPDNVWVANEHALLLWHGGRFDEAAAMYDDLAAAQRAHGQTDEQLRAAFGSNRAWTCWALGRNAQADALLARPYSPPGSAFEEALRRANRATVLTSLGRSTLALQELEAAEPVLRAYPLHHADVLHRRSVVYHRAGRHADALAALQEGLPLARRVQDPYRLSYTLASLGAALAHLNDLAAARRSAAEALRCAGQIGFPLTLTIAHQGAAVVARLDGQPREALEHARQAAAVARRCRAPEQLGQSLLLCGPDEPGALQEALRIGTRCALPDLIWRPAAALAELEGPTATAYTAAAHAATARQALDRLRAQAPAGWHWPPT